MKNTIIVVCVLLVVAFLAGFLPTYLKGQRLENELRAARQENNMGQLRDLACLAYLQAIHKDYGLAAGTSARLFDRTREVSNQSQDSMGKKPFEELLGMRDKIISELAQGDPAVMNDLQGLLVKTREATSGAAHALPAK